MLSSSYRCLLLFLFPAVNVSFKDPELKATICPAAKGTYVCVCTLTTNTQNCGQTIMMILYSCSISSVLTAVISALSPRGIKILYGHWELPNSTADAIIKLTVCESAQVMRSFIHPSPLKVKCVNYAMLKCFHLSSVHLIKGVTDENALKGFIDDNKDEWFTTTCVKVIIKKFHWNTDENMRRKQITAICKSGVSKMYFTFIQQGRIKSKWQ